MFSNNLQIIGRQTLKKMIGKSIELYTTHHSLNISEQSNNQKIFNL